MAAKSKKPKTKKQNKYILPIIIILIVVVFGLAFGVTYLINQQTSRDQQTLSEDSADHDNQTSSKESSSNTEQDDSGDTKKDDSSEASDPSDSSVDDNPQKPIEYEGGNANKYAELTGYISNMSVANNVLSVRAIIDQSTSGTCSFVITSPSGTLYNKAADIEMIGTSGGCIVDVPLQKTEAGNYKITINLNSANKTGKITGEVHVE